MTIGKLNVRIGANVKPLGAGLKSASQKLTSFVKRNVSLKKSLLAVAAAGTAAVAAFTAMGIAGIKNGGMLSDMSEKLDIASEKLAEYQLRMNTVGVEFKKFETGIQKMVVGISEAAQGMGEAKAALEELGVDVQKLNRMSPDEQFERIAVAMRNVALNTDKVRIASDLFGLRGIDLLRVLNQTTEAIDASNKKAKLMGLTLSNIETTQLDAAADALGEMKLLVKGVANQFGLYMAPAVIQASKSMQEFIDKNGGIREMLEPALDRIVVVLIVIRVQAQMAKNAMLFLSHAALSVAGTVSSSAKELANFNKLLLDSRNTGKDVLDNWVAFYNEAKAGYKALSDGDGALTIGDGDSYDEYLKQFEALDKALDRLDFQTRLAKGQFDAMEKGAAEAAYSMGLMKDLTVDLSTSTAGLTEEQRRLNDAMRKLAIVQFENEASLERIEEQSERIKEVGRGIGDEFQSGIEGMISSLGRGEGALESFKRSALNMLSQIGSALASAGLTGLFAAHQANKGSPGLFTGQGLEPSMNLVGAGANGASPSTSGDTYYMIDARGSESEEILTRKIEGVMQKNEPGIIQKSVTSAREERIRETGTP